MAKKIHESGTPLRPGYKRQAPKGKKGRSGGKGRDWFGDFQLQRELPLN